MMLKTGGKPNSFTSKDLARSRESARARQHYAEKGK
jgi:hypothetical protein